METIVGRLDAWQFRLTRPWSEIAPLIQPLIDGCQAFVVYEHPFDTEIARTHVHGVLVACKWGEDSIRTKFMKVICPEKADYMLSKTYKVKGVHVRKLLDDGVFVYQSKGNEPKFQKGFADKMLAEQRAKWVDPRASKSTEGKTILEKVATIRKIDMLKEMIQLVGESRSYETEHVLKCVRDVLVKHDQVVGMYKMMDYHDAVCMRDEKSSFIRCLASKINMRM